MVSKHFLKKLFLTVFFSIVVSPFYGFIFISTGGYLKGARPVAQAPAWVDRSVTFVVNADMNTYGGSLSADISSAEFKLVAEQAVEEWRNACDVDFRLYFDGTVTTERLSSDGINVISWDNRTTAEGNAFGNRNVLAAAWSSVLSNQITDCDIVMNGEFAGTFGVDGDNQKYDVLSTMVHEVGHCLGIDHPIEPPDYTAGNSFLLASSMVQTAVAGIGDLDRRTIDQDDIDAIECVYQYGKALRAGDSCSSYHGTNGGGTISGSQTGGPTATREESCSREVTANSSEISGNGSGSGCLSSAVASDGKANTGNFWGFWGFIFCVFLVAVFLKKVAFKWMWMIVLLPMLGSNAHARFIISPTADFRLIKGGLLNDFTQLTPTGEWVSASQKKIQYPFLIGGHLSYTSDTTSTFNHEFGIQGKYFFPEKATSSGTGGVDGVAVTKTTKLKGWLAGLRYALRYHFSQTTHLVIQVLLGYGESKLSQEIVGAAAHNLGASASLLDGSLSMSVRFNIFGSMAFEVGGGYAYSKTTFYKVTSASGTAYHGFDVGERLQIGTTDFQANLSGPYAMAGVVITL